MRLIEIEPDDIFEITKIYLKDSIMFKPLAMGLTEGAVVRCVSKINTTLELDIHGVRLAISEDIAKRYGCKKLDK